MSDEQLGDAYRKGSRPRSRDGCPPSSQLVDFAAGTLRDDALADHLGDCSACAEEYLALRAVAPRKQGAAFGWPLAAAALLLLTIGLAATTVVLLDRNRDLDRALARNMAVTRPPAARAAPLAPPHPRLVATNVAVIDLFPAAAALRGTQPEPVLVPSNADEITAILNLDDAPQFTDYALDIADAHGRVVWSGKGLQRSPNDTFAVHLPRPALPESSYHLRLYGTRDGKRTLLESYALDLRGRQ